MENSEDRSARRRGGLAIRPGGPDRVEGRVDDRFLKVLKFGGTSVGSVEAVRQVVQIVRLAATTHRLVVVTSAASGVTDRLAEALAHGSFAAAEVAEGLWRRYHVLAAGLLRPPALRAYEGTLFRVLRAHVLTPAYMPSPAERDRLLAVGERLSAPLVAHALQEAGLNTVPYDAAALIRTDDTHGEAVVDAAETYRGVQAWHARLPAPVVPVVTGFIGSTPAGVTTTLGRGGSDYSAALLAAALQASVLERWTDVPGLYTDDPRTYRHARPLTHIRLEQAWAWNHVGRLGMHRKALDPIVAAEIPVNVRCTAAPDRHGTWILPAGYEESVAAVAS